MRDRPSTSVVHTFHLTRPVVLVALMGIAAIVTGLLAPLTAQAGDHRGGGVDPSAKPWICHPVEGVGETGYGWNLIDPSKASEHLDEETGTGQHPRKDGRTDVYAVWNGASWTCPGGPTSPTTEPTSPTTEPTSPTTEPTTATGTPSTGATVPSTTSSSPAVPAETPEETPEEGATVAPTVPSTRPTTPAAEPEVGAVRENAVPQAHTDGADLAGQDTGWTALQTALVGAGLLMLTASGMLSVRRQRVD